MKTNRLVQFLAICAVFGFFWAVGLIFSEKDPAYLPHPATHYGRPAFVQLHRPSSNGIQWVTFYHALNAGSGEDFIKDGKKWIRGHKICTVDSDLALYMHHETPGY